MYKILISNFVKLTILIFIFVLNTKNVYADNSLKLYFFNDSVNGFQVSDRHETHNMGFLYNINQNYFNLDLSLITPDMFEYENEYREANRSFGEFIRLRYGTLKENNDKKYDFYLQALSQGEYGIKNLQSMIHSIANFQDDVDLLERVRMPNGNWVGAGLDFSQNSFYSDKNTLIVKSYVGTNRAELNFGIKRKLITKEKHGLSLTTSFSFIPYDNIVNSFPIRAKERNIIPFGILEYEFINDKYTIKISETASLPSIESDNKIYLRLGMSLQFPFNF